MLRAVIFDMDGVLVDSESRHYSVLRDLLAEYGYQYTVEAFRQYCGVSELEMWPRLLKDIGICANVEELFRKHWERYWRDIDTNGLPAFPGTLTFLRSLKERGYQLAVASATQLDTVLEFLDRLGYRGCFDCVVSSQSCAHGKPEPDVFLLAASQLGVAPEDCIVVEDSANGMLAAWRAGMKWVGFNGAKISADVSHAPFTFSDYRTITPKQLVTWYNDFPAVETFDSATHGT